MMFDVSSLNKAQKQAVLETTGPVMILAGAGSGKTRTLVTRISRLIEEEGVSPYKVLALTFSNKAAKEMRERISTMVSADIGALQMTTFHAFCAKVLRSEANYLGLSRNFTIYDTSESKAIAKNILQRHGINQKEMSPFEILNYIDSLKNIAYYDGRDISEENYEIDFRDAFYQYYKEYEAELHKANAIDFGGLITGVIELFEKFPDVLKRYQERYEYVLVDEYQDTNRAQFDLVKMLCEKKRNICVVGDEDQSIYSWRGADIRNILDFEKIFPEVKVIKLEQNYRSSGTIIEAATSVIARNTMRKGKDMWTDNSEGEQVRIVECQDDKVEADYVGNEIKKLADQGTSYSDMAVFYRTNSQSRLIEDSLRRLRIPYRVVAGLKFYDRKEIKDVLAYMRLVVNSKDSLAFSRIINVPARGIGATSLRKLEEEAIRSDCSLWEIVGHVVDNPTEYKHIKLSAKIKTSLGEFANLMHELKLQEEAKESPSILYEKILHESGYWDFLKASKDFESLARLENLEELGNAITQYEEANKEPTLTGFLETITLDQNVDDDSQSSTSGEVSLMTVHGAKGLEFPYVYVTGAEENIFPSFRSLDEGEYGEEEERRLFYVAMTRAMNLLTITFAQGRMLFGQVKFNGPSRFLQEIPPKLCVWMKPSGQKSSFSSKAHDPWADDDFSQVNDSDSYDDVPVYQVQSQKSQKTEVAAKSSYPKGVVVIHALYGEGKVMSTTGFGQDEVVTIQFSDGAMKKFAVKFAPLTLRP